MSEAHQVMIQTDAQMGNCSPSHLSETDDIPHDIFLSHSGKQKGFAKDLYKELECNSFNTFFDITDHSLPLGEHFPTHICKAAKTCKLALVILSEEFVCSNWPMIELCLFVQAGIKVLPLFFKLSPADIKCNRNLKRWRKAWSSLAAKQAGGRHPINLSTWENALVSLSSLNGLLFDPAKEEEQTYISRIVSKVSTIVPPFVQFSTTYIAGKDRLCQVILDTFGRMERDHSSRLKIPGPEFASTSTSSFDNVTSVLGLYGHPGSGKSTLCKCLVDHFRPLFGSTKTLYLNFSSTATHAEVVSKLKELRSLTNFKDRVSIDKASDLENVESLLRSCHLSSCKVFLVVDNISDKSWEELLRILQLGFARGSKLILVAHTLDVLRPILDSLKDGLHWACDSMAVPSINEEEAAEILWRTATGSYAASNKDSLVKGLTFSQQEIVEHIVQMSKYHYGVCGEDVWLPLVMKAVGARLLKYEKGYLKEWESDIESFWERVKTYEQSAVIDELLGNNFTALPEHLQLLFLDVSLIFLQLEHDIDKVSAMASIMQELDKSRIKTMLRDLERHGFLTVWGGNIVGVHDVYLKFAKSIEDCPKKLITNTSISWCWKVCQIEDIEAGRSLLLKEDQSLEGKGKVRALVLKGGESCERVDLQGFSGLKAVVLQGCKALVVLGLAGLTSLLILDIRNCSSFGRLECYDSDYASLHNVRRYSVQADQLSKAVALVHQDWEQVPYLLQPIVKVVKRVIGTFTRQPHSLEVGLIASRMRNLQVLHLQNTGIARLDCVGDIWPQLQNLAVIEQHLEMFKLGNLPKLEQFFFRDVGHPKKRYVFQGIDNVSEDVLLPNRSCAIWRCKERNERYLLQGKDLMVGCPKLKQVRMHASFFKQGQLGSLPPNVVSLELHHLFTATELPDISSSAHTLQHLDVLWCERLERVNLETGFVSLRTLNLYLCYDMVELIGLGSLPSLRVLHVCECRKLESLKGFENSEMLEELVLDGLRELREISCFSSLRELHTLTLKGCRKLAKSVAKLAYSCNIGKLRGAHLCEMGKLKRCLVTIDGECCFNLSKCNDLECLRVYCQNIRVNDRDSQGELKLEGLGQKLQDLSIEGSTEADFDERVHDALLVKCGFSSMLRFSKGGDVSLDLSSMLTYSSPAPRISIYLESRFDCFIKPRAFVESMERLSLSHCDVLDNMEGIEHLWPLSSCEFKSLNNLRSLRGVESLINLKQLTVEKCPVLEEMPSLHALVRMKYLLITDCPKLKAVKGCDSMTRLRKIDFHGCESMERFPFRNLRALNNLQKVDFSGCKFASDVESMGAWAMEELAPACLRHFALSALLKQYDMEQDDACVAAAAGDVKEEKKKVKERVAEVLWWFLLRWMPCGDDGCLDFSRLEEVWMSFVEVFCFYRKEEEPLILRRGAVRELGQRLGGIKKEELLLQQQPHLHTHIIGTIINFLDDHHASSFMFSFRNFAIDIAIYNTYQIGFDLK